MSDAIKDAVREKYSQAALRAGSSCCGDASCGSAISANLYADAETGGLPEAAVVGKFMSAFIRARKPQAGAGACCGPACCN